MKFDHSAQGEGVVTTVKLESGKAVLQWTFSFCEEAASLKGRLQVSLKNAAGQLMLLCEQRLEEEEPLQAVLLHPQLWSMEAPYLYELEVLIYDEEEGITDRIKRKLPLYQLEKHAAKGWLLNGEEITIKAVEYSVENKTENQQKKYDETKMQQIAKDFGLLKELGANCLRTNPCLAELCMESGFLVWQKEMGAEEELPCLLGGDGERLSSLFYQYKAKWCRQPFVYLAPEEVCRLPSGNLQVTVYSSCNRVVLYTDGVLFEFQSGEGTFIFREVPAKGPCIVLAAEGEECSMSLSLHKTFTKLSPIGDISTVK